MQQLILNRHQFSFNPELNTGLIDIFVDDFDPAYHIKKKCEINKLVIEVFYCLLCKKSSPKLNAPSRFFTSIRSAIYTFRSDTPLLDKIHHRSYDVTNICHKLSKFTFSSDETTSNFREELQRAIFLNTFLTNALICLPESTFLKALIKSYIRYIDDCGSRRRLPARVKSLFNDAPWLIYLASTEEVLIEAIAAGFRPVRKDFKGIPFPPPCIPILNETILSEEEAADALSEFFTYYTMEKASSVLCSAYQYILALLEKEVSLNYYVLKQAGFTD